ncbi:hypothetical protein [Novosphingobium sp. ST904]|uniref:hypothetical protein n=1 Tax=Novosphingobium sp. ST904 TaxID=1684385 RepID=UPI0006C8796F|nr:hypothetical protein [Novosphingobium sp. ST904]KPH66343.1 hypothetical protein ADT71_06655 [Novosphingobium sp. ST904]TCM42077.1 hypothetical protein EDF59_10237 [Novosphingobium sp. ST904]
MRPIDDEKYVALECLRLANGNVDEARRMLAFVNGGNAADGKDGSGWSRDQMVSSEVRPG